MKKNSKNISNTKIASGNFLKLTKIEYSDKTSQIRSWESVERVNSHGASIIIAKLQPSNRLILIEQFRPPANNYVIEFPAGLIDEGETALQSAIRELKEETGYISKPCKNNLEANFDFVSMPLYSSPGVTGETITFVQLEIDEINHGEVIQELEPSEDLTVHLVPLQDLHQFLLEKAANNVAIDAKLYAFSLANLKK
ncbi:NUDIX hydrolase [Lentisphaerota bacterium WC36G]|nr:NUDIX hydrolase [Lentisphaerae bacterium WC36]